MPMTSDAKSALSKTIRSLRTRLLDDLHAATEGVYRLSLDAKDAKLGEAARIKRERLESWIAEQIRALPEKEQEGAGERFRHEVEKEAASTLLNRIVFLRLLEASDLRAEKVVTGGWESRGYKDFREFAPELVRDDESEGYAQLLQLIFDDLAIDLPGLFGNVGLTALIPVPSATLRAVVEALDVSDLESCWTDDMTFGWIYQYWNDPEREHLDDKINPRKSWGSGKIEPHEIASKTQMFTERYMVDWLLQNSLGPMWLAMCKKHGWTPEVEADGTLAHLEERRSHWRAKRESGRVSLTDLMPLESEAEKRWAYYSPQPIPEDAVLNANDSVRNLKLLDPAVGSGHFLVVAFDLLRALYREEARHRGEEHEPRWSDRAIVERIIEHNLNGIDLDPRAVQIAAAALWLKAQNTCRGAKPQQLNLVASSLRLSRLPADDPARKELREEVERETGIPSELTLRLIDALTGADHLGSLLKIDSAIDKAIAECEDLLTRPEQAQGNLFDDDWKERRISIDVEEAKATLLSRLELFLHVHSHGDDLGLKLKGEQLAAGVRFVRLLAEGQYDIVCMNPPYLGSAKLSCVVGYPDLFSGMLERAVDLLAPYSRMAAITPRSWFFQSQYQSLRKLFLTKLNPALVADLHFGAFEELKDVSITMLIAEKGLATPSIFIRPVNHEKVSRTIEQATRNAAGLISKPDRFTPDLQKMRLIDGAPFVYQWNSDEMRHYIDAPKLGAIADVKNGLQTNDNTRFIRWAWENRTSSVLITRFEGNGHNSRTTFEGWVPYLKGGQGRQWLEPLLDTLKWYSFGLEVKLLNEHRYGSFTRSVQNQHWYFAQGVAFTTLGRGFSARAHRYRSVFGNMGRSVFGAECSQILCLLNSALARETVSAINPTLSFTTGDVNRLPVLEREGTMEIWETLVAAFEIHESHREPSVEFQSPGCSPWRHAQEWAQVAVDRPEAEPLLPYKPVFDNEPPTDHLSFALGVALGRFAPDGQGILDGTQADSSTSLPSGICFLDGSLETDARSDSLGHHAAQILHEVWQTHGSAISLEGDVRTWLRLKFFGEVHKSMYEHRPIYFPLSSLNKTFVAHISIHRWVGGTLRDLLAEHLQPVLARLEGEVTDLRESSQSPDKKIAGDAERRYDQVSKWKQELDDFIALVQQCAEKGPPPTDNKIPEREVDARYAPDLDDGVMINSAALWPLLEPQWREPKNWWKELASSKGKKDYDWSHLSARYFPSRVDQKCQKDPSLAFTHGCFWKYHPETAYKWELRFQDEIAPDFTIDEVGSDEARRAFEKEYPEKVEELVEAERKRREKNRKKREKESASAGPLFDPSNEKDSERPAR